MYVNDEVVSMSVVIVVVGFIWFVLLRFRIVIDVGCVFGEYRNVMVDIVVILLMNR